MIKETIQKLLDSNLSAFQIAKDTGVDASSIQRMRSGERSLDRLSLGAAEKLYLYQLNRDSDSDHQLTMDLNYDRLTQYKDELAKLQKCISVNHDAKQILRMNANVQMALDSLIDNLETDSVNDRETLALMRDMIRLLNSLDDYSNH